MLKGGEECEIRFLSLNSGFKGWKRVEKWFKDAVFQGKVRLGCPKIQENTDWLGNQPSPGLRNLPLGFGQSQRGFQHFVSISCPATPVRVT